MKSQGLLHFIAPVFLSPSLAHECDNGIISIPKAVLVDNGVDVSFQTGPNDIIMNKNIFILLYPSHPLPPPRSISVSPPAWDWSGITANAMCSLKGQEW